MKINSLQDIRKAFSTQKKCEAYLKKSRWPHGVTCPKCGGKHHIWMPEYGRWFCKSCRHQFSLTSGTIFHRTKIELPKWFEAIWLLCNSPKSISSKQLERELGVSYETAWHMAKQIRKAMKHDNFQHGLCGIVEVDESEVKTTGKGGGSDTNTLFGMVERDGFLRMAMVENFKSLTLGKVVAKNFSKVHTVYSDGAHWLRFLSKYGEHQFVRHYTEYCKDDVNINTIENVWSLLKRGIVGIFHHISTKHLQEYLDEFSFRYGYRKNKPAMFDIVLANC